MPANINGMKAIIKHNVFKQLKRLSKNDKDDIFLFIDSLSIDELKHKGLTKQITDQFRNEKPRKVLSGGMKRRIEQTGEPKRRSFIRRAIGTLVGEPYNEEDYNIQQQEAKLKNLIYEERKANEACIYTKKQIKIAVENERMAREQLSVIQQQMQIEIVKASRATIDEYQIRSEYADLKMQLELIPTGRHLATPEEQERLLTEIRYLDLIYFIHKNRHI